jgi:GT2 family glycosyltransferase
MKTLYDSDYPPSHLTYLRRDREEPWGISGGRNEAFKFVETEFVLPLDGDDWIAATFLEKTLAKIQEKEWIGIVSTLGIYHGEKEGELFGSGIDKTYEDELRENRISVCSLIRSKAVDAAGLWDTNLKAWEDWDMWLRILSLGWTHRVVKEPLLHYRLHHGGMNQWGQDNKEFLIQYMRKKYPGFME